MKILLFSPRYATGPPARWCTEWNIHERRLPADDPAAGLVAPAEVRQA